ncbi:probable E3 ubiquitin-protein ligase ARI8 [Euphorbia lathyris]|uniref:probable E3 ubiquitin-protein ligase ARI8 n=1 Tax=Euphorbia lathyris TaxID=212925 RepID=UPI003313B2F5
MQTTPSSPEDDSYNLGYDDDNDDYSDDDFSSDDHHQANITIDSTILNEIDIRQRIDDEISQISSILSLPKPYATVLLCFFNWSVTKIHDSWFTDESGVRLKLGLLEKPVRVSATEFTCGICFDSFTCNEISSAACGHPFCNDCWSSYISTSINNDGVRCLVLRCPEPSCTVSVGRDLVGKLVSEDDMEKYSRCLIRSYVEGNSNMKWCPGAGCVYAIEAEGNGGFDVTCRCLTSFCWNCEEESHRPVDCDTVKRWISKNHSESENVNYILAYCKPCPKCRRPIEKNEGCMHMVCRVCLHSFCWLCLAPYDNHMKCNKYSSNDVKKKEMAKQSLEKYTHYFERWDANRKSKLKALEDFQNAKNVTFKKLSEAQGVCEEYLDFLNKAWLQVIECRRVLEWSYAYGFYMPEEEHGKKEFFEYLQGEAENGLEKLHDFTEKELEPFLEAYDLSVDFSKFRTMLIALTVVTGNYFEKLVRALENGLSDVVPSCDLPAASSSSKEVEDYWHCDRCTFANPGVVSECRMCHGQ